MPIVDGYVTSLVNYLPHSEVKSSRIEWQSPAPRNWFLASLPQRNNRLLFLAYRSHETQRQRNVSFICICKFKLFSHFDWFSPMICLKTDERLTSSLRISFLPPCVKMAESFENLDHILRDWAKNTVQKVLWRYLTGTRSRKKKKKPFLI